MVGYPSEKDFKNMVHAGMIPNCPITLDYIKNDNIIFGPNAPSLKGKMVRRKTKPVVSNYGKTLKEILQLHRTVSVVADIMFFNGMEFLVSISRHVKFTMVQYIGKRTTGNISKSLENIVEKFYMYREFENIRRIMPGISTLNMTMSYEHVT